MERAFLKCKRVIESCKTHTQLIGAAKMVDYFEKLFKIKSLTDYLNDCIYLKYLKETLINREVK